MFSGSGGGFPLTFGINSTMLLVLSMSEIFSLLWSVSSLGCDAATGTATACGYKACGSLSFSSNKLSNEGNNSGKKKQKG